MSTNDDDRVERAAAELRRPVRFGEAFDDRVMEAVRDAKRPGVWARLRRRRPITGRPIRWALAAALLVAAAVAAGRVGGNPTRGLPDRASAAVMHESGNRHRAARQVDERRERDVQFVLVAPTARKVTVVGDFNDWDSAHAAFQAEHRGGGVWAVTAAVPVGHHRYAFVVDDSVWMTDPAASRALDNDYGMPISALVVGGESGR